jgi:hypothetical protein
LLAEDWQVGVFGCVPESQRYEVNYINFLIWVPGDIHLLEVQPEVKLQLITLIFDIEVVLEFIKRISFDLS